MNHFLEDYRREDGEDQDRSYLARAGRVLVSLILILAVLWPMERQAGQSKSPPSLKNEVSKKEESRTVELSGEGRKGIYFSASAIARKSDRELEELIDRLKTLGLNSIVIDVKNAGSSVTYSSAVPLADEIGAVDELLDPKELLQKFHRAQIYVIARQVVFKDPLLARHQGRRGPWVSPESEQAVSYNLAIALEVAQLGFDEVQFDYIRYDDDGRIGGNYPGRSRAIASFLRRARMKLPAEIKLSIDSYGRTLWRWNGKDKDPIGQNLEKLEKYLDYVSPMIYPSHYTDPDFVRDPYHLITTALKVGHERLQVPIRPFIQAFDRKVPSHMGLVTYIVEELRAIEDAGADGFLVWNPRSDYSALWRALRRRQG